MKMNKDKNTKKQTKYNVKIKSKIQPDLYHMIEVELHCNEKMPTENALETNDIKLKKNNEKGRQ